MDASEAKARLRLTARAARDALAAEVREQGARRIAEHGLAALRTQVRPGAVVSAYWPMRSEADPRPLARALAGLGAGLALPAFVDKTMLFRAWPRDEELVPAGFQTFEPPATAPVLQPTLVLAPLLAFDRRGGRLGWGKGYYDRALGELDAAAARSDGARPFVCGIAFACQEVAEVPLAPHDRLLDAIVTEAGWRLRC